MTESGVFAGYASAYDALYREKDYGAECDFLEAVFRRFGGSSPVRRILDLGCGTGGHALPLAQRGYEVFGVDLSCAMLDQARAKASAAGLSTRLTFEQGDIQNFNSGQSFDAVVCMFAVLGYQISNEALFSTLTAARRQLKEGGLFVCDFWYGPAVLTQRPTDRCKIVPAGDDRLMRIARPEIDLQRSVVAVHYHLLRMRGSKIVEEVEETHRMRFFFQPELEFFMNQAGFSPLAFCEFQRLEKPPSQETWNVSAIAR